MEAKIRISYGAREVEIEGSETFVREQLDSLSDTFESFASNNDVADAVQEDYDGDRTANQDVPKASGKLPETFGEYMSQFPKDINQDEQMLIAGYFAQRNSSESAFTTKEANDLLKEQGIKVGNPSQSVSRSKNSKNVFALQKGRFRVSQGGVDHINSLNSE